MSVRILPSRMSWLAGLAALVLAGGCTGGWVEESSGTGNDLFGVFGLETGEVFAVGAGGTVLLREQGRWRQLSTGSQDTLRAVWGFDSEHVVALGDNCAALEYSGPVEPPEEGEPPPDLHPIQAASCGDFRDVDGSSEHASAFVVGERTTSQWYGGGNMSNGRSFNQRMQGVSMQVHDEIYAVGDQGAFYRKHDGNWSQLDVTVCGVEPVDGQCPEGYLAQPILWDVWAGPDGQGAVVGSGGGIWRLPAPAEGEWEAEDTDFDADLLAAWGHRDEQQGTVTVYAAGRGGVLARIEPERIVREAPGPHQDLNDIWVSPDGADIYAVGNEGVIVHFSR